MHDPLTDPQPGDRVRAGGMDALVTGRTECAVEYEIWLPLPERVVELAQWRSWCRRNKAVEVKE